MELHYQSTSPQLNVAFIVECLLSTVDAARVHLVLPEREAFSRNKPAPSASVIVRSRINASISRRQALSIQALVAGAVPEMAQDKVVVISSNGEMILGDNKSGAKDITLETVKVGIERRLADNIADILTARVGAGNARVQVAVSLNHERRVTTSKNFNPDQQVVRSTESSEETSSDGSPPGGGTVDVANNLPDALGDSTGGGASSSKTAVTREVINYEIGSSNTETVREAGEIERISIAVLINGLRTVAENGDVTYENRSQDELDRLRHLIESASGINLDRGDSISIDSLQFVDHGADLIEPVGISFGQMLSENLASILRGLFALGLIAAVLILGVRPTLRLMLEAPKIAAPVLLDTSGPAGNAAAPLTGASHPGATPMIAEPTDNAAMLPPLISGSGNLERQRISAFTNIVEQEPEESLKIINHWLTESA